MKNHARGREVLMSDNTHKFLLMGARYFRCSMGTFIALMLEALRIVEMDETKNKRTIRARDIFDKYLSDLDSDSQFLLRK